MPYSQYIKKRFLLVDDHTLIRSALVSLLKQTYPDAIIEESEDGTDVIEKLKNTPYDLIIMDIHLPNTETVWLIESIHANYPVIPVLIYSMSAENVYAPRVLKAGAKGFVSKVSSLEELNKAIALALNGKTYISQAIAEQLSQQTNKKSVSPFANLSARELQIGELLLAGKTVTEISKTLKIQPSTVGTHKGKIFLKLKVINLLELKEMSDIYQY